jgi:hypothetical protein
MQYNKYIADWLLYVFISHIWSSIVAKCVSESLPRKTVIAALGYWSGSRFYCSELFRGFPARHITTCLLLHALLFKQLKNRCYERSSSGKQTHTHGKIKDPSAPSYKWNLPHVGAAVCNVLHNFHASWTPDEKFIKYSFKSVSRNIGTALYV